MTRGDLCSSQQSFKAYQGGVQSKNNVVVGLYIDKFTEARDFLGRNKLITCSGGGRYLDIKTRMFLRKDTKPDVIPRWEAALHTPIIVIMGKEHPQFQSLNLPSVVRKRGAFVELGAFMVTKIWNERVQQSNEKGVHVYKVWKLMLQTLDPTSKPWYWKEVIPNTMTIDGPHQPEKTDPQTSNGTESPVSGLLEATCIRCKREGPKVFENATWVCLKEDCDAFFKVGSEELAQIGDDNKELRYSEDFINHNTTYKDINNIPTMFEPLPEALAEDGGIFGTEAFRRSGMTCPECRCASARKHWVGLKCPNCGFEYNMPPIPYPLSLVEEETKRHTKTCRVKDDGVTIKLGEAHVDKFVENDEDCLSTRFIYMIMDDNGYLVGTLVVERPSDASKKAPGGADELYTSIEADGSSMDLQRSPVRCAGTGAEQLTGHFQSNFGALYEFGQKRIGTKPFETAPDVVLKSLAYLKHFGQKALASSQKIASRENYRHTAGSTLHTPQKPFNELLALAYREDDKISWHDDGEAQLTGVISTASLGSPGKMSLRFKKSKTAMKDGNKPHERASILEVQLRHGDVATMCDTQLQALTDHAVDPKGIRRYAMTCRTINLKYYRQASEKKKLAQKGLTVEDMEKAAQIPDHALSFAYNGTKLSD
ncbi:hypothetical protein KVR01_003622 [Diaporthe batatas]|uniref:uncharacterized protein n=1 Tax=Diaporthe batatas TaxID=748121 RepID=UPI001D038E6F|nr:uncharacterized protein KVR01_003622 [Diaporthe batatas]KAG8167933.1 hypothetical protein KVR01_003622 [Diaporthe batatas]